MASTAILSGLGFLFWVFVAHLYPTADIGVASAVIQVSVLVSNAGMLGLNVGLIRFLPESRTPSGDVNAALVAVGATAVVLGAAYAAWGLDGRLPYFGRFPDGVAAFGLLLAAVALNSLTDGVFVARRRAHYHTMAYTAFGSVRLVLALVLVGLGALGIFLAYTAAGVLALALSLWYMRRGCEYRLLTRPTFGFLNRTRRFARNNYLSILLAGLPSQVVPSLILARLGGSPAAYFAMAMTIANLLYIVPTAVEQSLLAEGANDADRRGRDLRRAAALMLGIVVPTVLVALVAAPWLLRVFGRDFSTGSTPVLQLLALATVFLAVSALGTTLLNLQHRSGWNTGIQALTAAVTLLGSWLLLPAGLPGVGLAFLAGAATGATAHVVVQLVFARRTGRARFAAPAVGLAASEPR
jgi:O-antigen/teichoic acid export membrane protein